MSYASILDVKHVKPELVEITKPARASKLGPIGCDNCPQNSVKGIHKVFNKVRGKDIMIFTTSPGPKENDEQETLSGSSGDFLWDELEKIGIKKKDCDIQNTVRCYPADKRNGFLYKREPKKEEIHGCSEHNQAALAKSKAKIYILLGAMTHKQILGKEFKKSKKIFWSEALKAKVYCLAHPNYFLGGHAPQIALDEFRDALKAINSDLDGKAISQYAYIEKQDYRAVRTVTGIKELYKQLSLAAKKGIRVTADIEWDTIDGKKLWLCCGFCTKPGTARVAILDHPLARKVNGTWKPLSKKTRRIIWKYMFKIMADPNIKKAFHQGSSDVPAIEKDFGGEVNGYDYDTIYAEFLAHPDRRAYGLANVALQRYPQFGDYKTVILPHCIPVGTDLESKEHKKRLGRNPDLDKLYAYVGKNDLMHFSLLPLKKLVLRCGADADITKRIELSTKKKVDHRLLGIYRDAAFILAEMEPNGPEFDFKHCEKLKALFPPKFEKVKKKLCKLSGKKDFNPGSSIQVKEFLYKKLKIKPPDIAFEKKKATKDKYGNTIPPQPGTGKSVLELLSRKHEAPRLLQQFRKLGKIISTYLNAYEQNATLNNGKLKTKWWLTGTRTGRLSSGGDKQVKETKNENINLQNIHGDHKLQNLATADKDWRKVYRALLSAAEAVCPDDLAELKRLLGKVQATSDKDKQKTYNDQVYTCISNIKKQVYKSSKFERLCGKIVEKYGDVKVLLGFDQGQIEVRVMAQASGDEQLIADCMSGDIHSKVGHAMTGWPVEKIKKDKKTRTLTKNIHFGILFGLGINGLLAFIKLKDPDSTITEEEAQRLYENYFKAYPKVREFIERMRKFVEEHGFVENMFGFRRPLATGSVGGDYEREEEGDDDEQSSGAYWGNQAINTPVQGAAHCLMLMAIAILKRKRKKYRKMGVPTLEVHDYIGWKTPLRYMIEAYALGKHLLEKEPLEVVAKEYPEIDWKIPLAVEGKIGFRYGDSVECEEGGKLRALHMILADMFLETHKQELELDFELKEAA